VERVRPPTNAEPPHYPDDWYDSPQDHVKPQRYCASGIGVAVIAVIVILDPNGDFPHLNAELRDNGRVVGREPAGTGREFVCAVAGGGEAA
jgi:hypothetical protein